MWKGRFSQDTDEAVQKFTQSLDLDWIMALADIRGSIAHGRMRGHVGLLSYEEASIIEKNLSLIADEIKSGEFIPKVSLEDVHMNVESRLTELCGATGAFWRRGTGGAAHRRATANTLWPAAAGLAHARHGRH